MRPKTAEKLAKVEALLKQGVSRVKACKTVGMAPVTYRRVKRLGKYAKAKRPYVRKSKVDTAQTVSTITLMQPYTKVIALIGTPKEIAEAIREVSNV